MGAAGVGLVVAGAQMVSSMNAEGQEQDARIRESDENRTLARIAAADATDRGNKEAGQARTQGTKLAAQQNVAYSNSGVDATVGTPASVMAETRATSELDARTIENNAAREAWGFKNHGLKFQQQAQLNATRSANRQTGTVLTGLGRATSILSDYKGD